MLTNRQTKALDWMLTVLIEQTGDNAPDYQPEQAVEEICDIASIVELLPPGELRTRLDYQCEELRREQQVRVDELPKVGVTFTAGSMDYGKEFKTIADATAHITEWLAGLEHNTGADYRVSIEFLGQG